MKYSTYRNMSNAERRLFHARGGGEGLRLEEKARFNEALHTCPTRYQANALRRRRYAPNYMKRWDFIQDAALIKLQEEGKTLLEICRQLGRNPNGIVLRTLVLHTEPVFAGKRYHGRYYEEKLKVTYGA